MLLDLHPVESLNLDYCKYRSQYYLVIVDRLSGYLWARQTPKQSSEEAIKLLKASGMYNLCPEKSDVMAALHLEICICMNYNNI